MSEMQGDPNSADSELVVQKRSELARAITTLIGSANDYPCPIEGLTLFRRTTPMPCYRAAYEPSLTVFVQGRKRISLGSEDFICDGSTFLLSSIDVPIQSEVIEASSKCPLLSMHLKLYMPTVREVVSRDFRGNEVSIPAKQGLAAGKTTLGLVEACIRMIQLIQNPKDIPFMSALLYQEILYRVLCTEQAEQLRMIAGTGNMQNRAANAIAWLRANFAKPLRVEDLAEMARMGISTFHHQFRALTTMSPLQYQKQLRLQTARQRMLMDGLDVTSAAFEVGYESLSQFSREYGRYFGQSPRSDIKSLKETLGQGIEKM